MKNFPLLTTTLGVVSALLIATPALTQNQPASRPDLPSTKPDTTFNVQRLAGKCPSTVSAWTSSRYYEGGGEQTVIADTLAIASNAVLASSGKKFVEYKAPLKPAYASCVGRASSQDPDYSLYSFRFGKGNVYFRVSLPRDTPSKPSAFMNRSVLASRPYVRWAIAD